MLAISASKLSQNTLKNRKKINTVKLRNTHPQSAIKSATFPADATGGDQQRKRNNGVYMYMYVLSHVQIHKNQVSLL